jgi:hypothetical protein
VLIRAFQFCSELNKQQKYHQKMPTTPGILLVVSYR